MSISTRSFWKRLPADFLLRNGTKKAACWAAFVLISGWLGGVARAFWDWEKKVFKRRVDNSVGNRESILLSDLFADALALCTGAGAGRLVARRPGAERW